MGRPSSSLNCPVRTEIFSYISPCSATAEKEASETYMHRSGKDRCNLGPQVLQGTDFHHQLEIWVSGKILYGAVSSTLSQQISAFRMLANFAVKGPLRNHKPQLWLPFPQTFFSLLRLLDRGHVHTEDEILHRGSSRCELALCSR